MAVVESFDVDQGGAKEPIKFPATKEERRDERVRRRLERRKAGEIEPEALLPPLADPDDFVVAPEPPETELYEPEPQRKQRWAMGRFRLSWTFISFLAMVAVPSAVIGFYYLIIASPQYVVETQFSVRGSNQSSIASFGLSGLFGSSVQSNDSYIVTSYIDSVQLIRDVKDQLGVDLRQYYSKPGIDFYYHISPDVPLEKFTDYWEKMIDVSFNSTTGNITLYTYAFSADDAKAIADDVLKVSEKLVNDLSEKNRQQMTAVASKQVERSENRLRKLRDELSKLRSKVEVIDPTILVKSNAELTQQLESQLSGLKTRLATLLESVAKDSPSARMLQKQVDALEDQIAFQKGRINKPGKGDATGLDASDPNVADVVDKFEGLTIDQDFATKAYTTSLAAFEAALSEAQKQERYFATFVAPMRPEIALYPSRWLNTLIGFVTLFAVWLISQFLFRSFRDHAI